MKYYFISTAMIFEIFLFDKRIRCDILKVLYEKYIRRIDALQGKKLQEDIKCTLPCISLFDLPEAV